jgi:glyoxylase-like metal-dependent hydrolase (beta-lactamase superfamily II)
MPDINPDRIFKTLAALLLGLAGLLDPAWSQGEAKPEAPPFTLKALGPNIYAAIDNAGGAGANAGVIIGEEAVAVIDSLYRPKATQALLAEIRKLSKLPIRFLVNTHYHIDHVAGNALLAQEGALVVAHRNVHGWVNSENLKFFGVPPRPGAEQQVAALVAPQIGLDGELRLYLGKRMLIVKPLPGHTGGDLVVSVPDAGLVFAGDLFWRRAIPNLIDADVSRWISTMDSLLDVQPGASVYVPGHGDLGTAADVKDFKAYLADLQATVKQLLAEGKTAEELQLAALEKLSAGYGTWSYFSVLAPRNIRDMQAELAGTKRRPAP